MLTEHVIGNMDLNVPFAVEDHLALDALVGLLLSAEIHNHTQFVKFFSIRLE